MATGQDQFRRRVQHKLAGRLLDTIDPDHVYKPTQDGETKFKDIDPQTRQEFEKQYGKYQKKSSPFCIQNILWLISSIAVFHFTDFYMVIRYNPKVNSLWFNIGAILILINISVAVFLVVWLTFIKKVPSEQWERRYPSAIPTATACFIFGSIFVNIGLWPVWGIFTPVILFVIFMGFIVTVAMFG
ncbi:hypothetical protein LOTGIDRAFT_231679 [Lottia gigantea]|uniref:Transmembrane protein 128 n=1 Tax=Lottia gigantea TaxID=225164 RepID=V3ZZA1_LOTGI|nr:hypothetical protein LOTGIDRAFT_231679 [Lottia gigantea]ESO96853.1 hypothetical protein LOTGIDRAFT_231679 [Lottia gigantea]